MGLFSNNKNYVRSVEKPTPRLLATKVGGYAHL